MKNEKIKKILENEDNKKVFIAMLNKMIDTLSDSDTKSDEALNLYEDLRESVIKNKELNKVQFSLLVLNVTFQANYLQKLIDNYKQALPPLKKLEKEMVGAYNEYKKEEEKENL